ncbi:MAG: S-layer homology domain-containing protein [Caryophanon sp.]|nr:S-layer homology domain-containing protein [Caryophanon sp.]
MANQPKKYQKFVATAATATLVATAVVPAASADAKFSDISTYAQEVQDEVVFLADLGVIKGFEDGTFKPSQNITRGQAVKMIGRFLEEQGIAEVPANWETVQSFDDIALNRSDRDLVKYAALVKEAGVFQGNGNVLNPSGFTTRENMALILDRLVGKIVGKTAVELAAGKENNVSDLSNAKEEAREAIAALNALGVSNAEEFKPKNNTQRVHFASFLARMIELAEEQTATPAISEVQALSKTKVVVTFNTPVDEVAKENFTIEGATVNGVELSEDKKTATLDVTGLEYNKDYTIAVKDVKVKGEAVDFGSKAFTTPAVTQDFTLRVTPAATTVKADGADNTIVKFELLNSAGEVDTNADNMVLEIGTTFGNLATNRVTVQDGVGQVVLSSEFSTKDVVAKVSAQVIEASADYKDLIGKIAGEATVTFTPAGEGTPSPEGLAVSVVEAESNQADRVTLYLDKATTVQDLVSVNANNKFATTVVNGETVQATKNNVNVKVSQGGINKTVVGFLPVEGNPKAVQVLLSKDTPLVDNAKVDVDAQIGTVNSKKSFTLTDARKPEFTGVTVSNLKTLDLKFSESYASGNFSIDGLWVDGKEFTVTPGEFDPSTGVDKRDTATLVLNKVVQKAGEAASQLYFPAGQHSITVTQLKDFAAATDEANISTTQTLNFAVQADTTAPTATVTVESPEQFRVKFNKDVDVLANNGDATALFNSAFEVYDSATGVQKYVPIGEHTLFKNKAIAAALETTGKTKVEDLTTAEITAETTKLVGGLLTVTEPVENEFVVELTKDWTQVFDTEGTKDVYYNYKYQFNLPKDTFLSLSNGIKNAEIKLDLNYAGSALNAADNVSPVINAIVPSTNDKGDVVSSTFKVEMSEPVKLKGKDNATDTLAQTQPEVPTVLAQFQGKDKAGRSVVVEAEVVNYTAENGSDMEFSVRTKDGEFTLQELVDAGYDENWTAVVRSISDDIGNTAATLTKDFVVKKTVVAPTANPFQIVSDENGYVNHVYAINTDKAGEKDRLEISFTKAVNFAGTDNLTSVYNWTLNGTKLSELSNVESILMADEDNNTANGYEKIIITFADDKAFGAKAGERSNVVAVTKGIKALDGTVLTGEHEVVARTIGAGTTIDVVTPEELKSLVAFENALSAINLEKATAEQMAALVSQYNALSDNAKALLSPVLKEKLEKVLDASNAAPVVVDGSVSLQGPSATLATETTVKALGSAVNEPVSGVKTISLGTVAVAEGTTFTVAGKEAQVQTQDGVTILRVNTTEAITEDAKIVASAPTFPVLEERITVSGKTATIKLYATDDLAALAKNAKGELSEAAQAKVKTATGEFTVELTQANAINEILTALTSRGATAETLIGKEYTVTLIDKVDANLTTVYTLKF